MNKKEIAPQASYTAAFGMVLALTAQLVAIWYASEFYSIQLPMTAPDYVTETVTNPTAIWIAVSISVSGLVTGIILVALAKCWQELTCIRILLNAETGRVIEKEDGTEETETEFQYR